MLDLNNKAVIAEMFCVCVYMYFKKLFVMLLFALIILFNVCILQVKEKSEVVNHSSSFLVHQNPSGHHKTFY